MNANKLSRFANYGIEDVDQNDVVAPEIEVEEVPVEQAVAETEIAETEVEEVEGDIEEMSDVAESLEAICFGIEATFKKGGLNRQGAAFALQSADLQLARLGLDGLKVSEEDFEESPTVGVLPVPAEPVKDVAKVDGDNKTSVEPDAASVVKSEEAGVAGSDNTDAEVSENVAVSQEAVANIREIIKKIMDTIANAMKAFYEKVKAFFDKAKLMIGNTGREAAALAKSIASAPGKFYKKKKLQGRLTKGFGKESAALFLKAFNDLTSVPAEVLTGVHSEVLKAFDAVLSDDEATQKQGLADLEAIDAKLAAELNKATEAVSNEETFEGEFEVISANEQEDLAKVIEDVAKKTLASKASDNAQAALNKLKDACNAFLKKVGDLGDKASASAKSAAGKVGALLSKATKAVADVFRTAYGKVAKGLKDGTDYVKMQFNNLTDKEGDDKEEATA